MSGEEKISPNDTYVLDEDVLDEMDGIALTGLLNELSEQYTGGDKDSSAAAPDDAEATGDVEGETADASTAGEPDQD